MREVRIKGREWEGARLCVSRHVEGTGRKEENLYGSEENTAEAQREIHYAASVN